MTPPRIVFHVATLRELSLDRDGMKLVPHEQVALVLGALALEKLAEVDPSAAAALMDGEDDLFNGYCLPEAGGP